MLHLALKEWAVICDLLLEGQQAIVLRKGGIAEDDGPGRFKLEHDRFALFPAWEHQREEGLKPEFQARVERFDTEPQNVTLRGMAEVAGIWPVPSRQAFDLLDDLHGWAPPQIDMRFNYKPDRPLYVVALRALRLAEPKTIAVHPDYWGCRSWVPLTPEHAVDDAGAVPAMDADAFAAVLERVAGAMRA